jgi:hypothetical protein
MIVEKCIKIEFYDLHKKLSHNLLYAKRIERNSFIILIQVTIIRTIYSTVFSVNTVVKHWSGLQSSEYVIFRSKFVGPKKSLIQTCALFLSFVKKCFAIFVYKKCAVLYSLSFVLSERTLVLFFCKKRFVISAGDIVWSYDKTYRSIYLVVCSFTINTK